VKDSQQSVTTELQELIRYAPCLYARWKLEQWPGFSTEIVRSQDWHIQFPDSENVQHNLKIGQIPRSRKRICCDSKRGEVAIKLTI